MNDTLKEKLKELYDDQYKNKSVDGPKDQLQKWLDYKGKLANKSFTLDDYTNTLSEREYLTNFLERRSKCFGVGKGGSSNQYMIKK